MEEEKKNRLEIINNDEEKLEKTSRIMYTDELRRSGRRRKKNRVEIESEDKQIKRNGGLTM